MADIRDRNMTLASCRFDWVFHGYDKMLEGKSTFSDIDAVAIVNNKALLIEHKYMTRESNPPQIFSGQWRVYNHFLSDPRNDAWIIAGDMEKSIPFYIEDLRTGLTYDLRSFDDVTCRKHLKDMLNNWNQKALENGEN